MQAPGSKDINTYIDQWYWYNRLPRSRVAVKKIVVANFHNTVANRHIVTGHQIIFALVITSCYRAFLVKKLQLRCFQDILY